jgi:hypothetical protein
MAKTNKKAVVGEKAKVKKNFRVTFDYNGETINIDCVGGRNKKTRMEFMDLINSKSTSPIFTNITCNPIEVASESASV